MTLRITDHRKQPLVLVRLQQNAELRKRYAHQKPWWRRSLIGYLLSIPFVCLGLFTVILEQDLLHKLYFPGAPLFLAVLLLALFWGVGPALISVLLGALTLNYFYMPPYGQLTIFSLNGLLQILPFTISGVVIAIITGQREAARLRALAAEQFAREHSTELSLTNQELEEVNKLKDQFLSIASHELKTPITTISGHAQIALRRISKKRDVSPDQEALRDALEKIYQQTRRLNMLIDDLLDVSRIRAGKLELRLQKTNLVEICRNAIEDQRLLSDRIINLEASPSSILLNADSERLYQVIVNLLSNALKYSPAESPVNVYVNQHDKLACIAVQDAGFGISEAQQTYIFEPFYRTPDAQSSPKSGLGLGLAICKDIIDRHGGHIWYQQNASKGSTFYVELPLS